MLGGRGERDLVLDSKELHCYTDWPPAKTLDAMA